MRRAIAALGAAFLAAPGSAFGPTLHAWKQDPDVLLIWQPTGTEWIIQQSADLGPPFSFQEIGRTTGGSFVVPNALNGPPNLIWRLEDTSVPPVHSFNIAWKVSLPIAAATMTDLTAISPPLYYWPRHTVQPVTPNNSVDFCSDNPGIGSVSRMRCDGTLGATQSCVGTKTAFNLTPGEAYFVTPTTSPTTLHLVGSNDPNYDPGRGGARRFYSTPCAACTSAYGIPFAVPPTRLANTAEELCQELVSYGEPVVRIHEPRPGLQWREHICGVPGGDFPLVPGQGYWAVATGPCGIEMRVW